MFLVMVLWACGASDGELLVKSVSQFFRRGEHLLPFFPLNLIGWFFRCWLALLSSAFIVFQSFAVSVGWSKLLTNSFHLNVLFCRIAI